MSFQFSTSFFIFLNSCLNKLDVGYSKDYIKNNNINSFLDDFLVNDVNFTRSRRYIHYFNDVPYTRWPFYICNMIFVVLFLFILYFNKFVFAEILLCVSFLSLIYFMCGWFYDMIIESLYFGKYNKKVRKTLCCGFALFLVSEILLFAGFFWTYFDRFFHLSGFIAGTSMPYGFEYLQFSNKPLIATFFLVASGYMGNLSYYWLKLGRFEMSWIYHTSWAIAALIFLIMQIHEYKHLLFEISDSVFSSIFYVLTGFHGFHVIVGFIFLMVQGDRMMMFHFTRERQLGYGLAMLYWHFVDIVWIFLFIFIYCLNHTIGHLHVVKFPAIIFDAFYFTKGNYVGEKIL